MKTNILLYESEDEDNNFLILHQKKIMKIWFKMIDELKEKIVFTEILNKLC